MPGYADVAMVFPKYLYPCRIHLGGREEIAVTAVSRFFGKRTKVPREEPHVHTSVTDGRKYIEPEEFIQLEKVREQMDELDKIFERSQER